MTSKVLSETVIASSGLASIWLTVKEVLPWGVSILVSATLVIFYIKKIRESKATTATQLEEAEFYKLKNMQLREEMNKEENGEN